MSRCYREERFGVKERVRVDKTRVISRDSYHVDSRRADPNGQSVAGHPVKAKEERCVTQVESRNFSCKSAPARRYRGERGDSTAMRYCAIIVFNYTHSPGFECRWFHIDG